MYFHVTARYDKTVPQLSLIRRSGAFEVHFDMQQRPTIVLTVSRENLVQGESIVNVCKNKYYFLGFMILYRSLKPDLKYVYMRVIYRNFSRALYAQVIYSM